MEGLEVASAEEAASGGRPASWSDGRRETQRDGCPLPASILIIIYLNFNPPLLVQRCNGTTAGWVTWRLM